MGTPAGGDPLAGGPLSPVRSATSAPASLPILRAGEVGRLDRDRDQRLLLEREGSSSVTRFPARNIRTSPPFP